MRETAGCPPESAADSTIVMRGPREGKDERREEKKEKKVIR